METQKFEIVSTQSNIDWVGKKVTVHTMAPLPLKKVKCFD